MLKRKYRRHKKSPWLNEPKAMIIVAVIGSATTIIIKLLGR
ncbi:hypothetical protein [Lactococcus lactis]|nr:hypothetical protein [Lactococcus lactis]